VSGERPPFLPDPRLFDERLTNPEHLPALFEYLGLPKTLMHHSGLIDHFLNDLALIRSFKPSTSQLETPIVAFSGDKDETAPESILNEWSKLCSASFRSYVINGDHNYFRSNRKMLLHIINDTLSELLHTSSTIEVKHDTSN
jgi:surfactin synthase thioesterase subunit